MSESQSPASQGETNDGAGVGVEPEAEGETAESTPGQRTRPAKAVRVQHIVGLMSGGLWVTGVTGPELAAEWGLAVDTVERDSAEASRRVLDQVATDDVLRAQIVATLQTITKQAMNKKQLRTAVESVKVLAGVATPKKVEVGGSLADILALGLAAGGTEPDSEVGE